MRGKACKGHLMYRNPLKNYDYLKCLRKCTALYSCSMVDFYDDKCEPKDYACSDKELVDAPETINYIRLGTFITTTVNLA